jgi:hypothetical protein
MCFALGEDSQSLLAPGLFRLIVSGRNIWLDVSAPGTVAADAVC